MARDKKEKAWIGGGAVAAVLLAAGLWTFAVSPQLQDVRSLHSQTADAQTQNLALQDNVARLRDQYAHIGVVKRQLADVQAELPSDNGLSALTTQLNAQAQAHQVKITQLTAGDPQPWAPPTDSSGATPAPSSSSSTTAATTTTGGTVVSPAGQLYVIPVSVTATGSQPHELAFAHAVQYRAPRAALVSSVQLQNGSGAGAGRASSTGSSLTLQMNVFVAPVAPSTTPAPTPSAAPTSTP